MATDDEVSSSEAPKETAADMASYSTDLSEAAWALIQPHLPQAKTRGRPRSTACAGWEGHLLPSADGRRIAASETQITLDQAGRLLGLTWSGCSGGPSRTYRSDDLGVAIPTRRSAKDSATKAWRCKVMREGQRAQ